MKKKRILPLYLPWKRRLLRIMKLAAVLLVYFNTLFAVNVVNPVDITLNVKGTAIKDVLKEIEEKSDYAFLFNSKQIDIDQRVDLSVDSESIENVLSKLFKGTDITYRMFDTNIVLFSGTSGSDQEYTVKGKVTDLDGSPLPGVNVAELSTTNGVVTNIDGEYTISVSSPNAVLSFSYVGFLTEEIEVAGQTSVNMIMVEDILSLEEVVVVGYGIQKKVNLTGSVAQVSTSDLHNISVTNTSSALQGKIAGISVSQNSGIAGEDNSNIKIRGIGTLNAGQEPLVLVDGIQMDMNNIDPMDIESISVLKDAASAAIYGSRAANGVILINTKSGERNQPATISYNAYYGMQEVTNLPKLLSAYEHAMLYNEALENDGLTAYFSEEDLNNLKNPIYVNDLDFPNNLTASQLEDFNNSFRYQDVDFASMNFRRAALQKHYLSIESGGKNSNGRMGVGYTNQEGTRVGNESESYNIKLDYDVSLFEDKLKAYSKLYYFRQEYDKGASGSAGNWFIAPWQGYYFPNGLYTNEADFADLELGAYNITSKNNVVGLLGARISLIKNLDVVLEYSQIRNNGEVAVFLPERDTYNAWEDITGANRSEISEEINKSMKQTGTATATYNVNFNDKLDFTFLGGTSFEEYTYEMYGASRFDLLNNYQPELSLGSSATMENWSNATEFALASFFGRMNINYANRYLFEANVRMDGSSRFASGNQWGTFPSASVGWRISEEEFLKDVSGIDNLKLRLSYGQLGNQNIHNYAARDILSAQDSYPIDNTPETTIGISSLANKGITWETTTMTDFGVDLNMFQQLNVSFDYYNKVSSDVLYRVAIPATTGIAQGPYRNIAEVQNKGWDLTLGWYKKMNNEFDFGTTFNLSSYVNEITKLENDAPVFLEEALDSKTDQYIYVWQEGHPINSFYGYTVGGIATQEQIDNGLIPDQGFEITAGDLWYKDIAGNDNTITDEDRSIIGDPHPDLIYSLNLTASWKGFDFSVLLEGVTGAETLLYSPMFRTEFKSQSVNKPVEILDRWTPDNPNAKYPKLSSLESKTRVSDFYIEDASYLRGKDLTIGYTLPQTALSKIKVKNIRLYANLRNFFTATDFRGLDPETTDYSDTSRSGTVPPNKVYSVGVQVKL